MRHINHLWVGWALSLGAAALALGQTPSTAPTTQPSGGPEAAAAAQSKAGSFWLFPSRPPLEGSMGTDRPGFSDSYVLVPRGYQHLEFGYTFAYDREDKTRTAGHTLGEFSLRTGLTDDFELRLKWSGFSFTESLFEDTSRWSGRRIMTEDHADGGTDMSLGFKTPLLKQDGLIPNLSLIPPSRCRPARAESPRVTSTLRCGWRGTTASPTSGRSTASDWRRR